MKKCALPCYHVPNDESSVLVDGFVTIKIMINFVDQQEIQSDAQH